MGKQEEKEESLVDAFNLSCSLEEFQNCGTFGKLMYYVNKSLLADSANNGPETSMGNEFLLLHDHHIKVYFK